MCGIYLLCWALLLFDELGFHYSKAEMNLTNFAENGNSTPNNVDLITTEDGPSTPNNVDLITTEDGPSTPNNVDLITTEENAAVICTSLDIEVQHITPLNDGYLYIGSTAITRVSISPPVGFIKELGIVLIHNGDNVDFLLKDIYHKGDVHYRAGRNVWHRYHRTSFQRMYGIRYVYYDITTSYSNTTENRLLSEYYVYLHNAKGVADEQTISINVLASYQWNGMDVTECPPHHFNFTIRTQLLKMNKTATFAMVAPMKLEMLPGINLLTKVTFKAWVPDYNPLIKVLLQRHTDALWIAYLKVTSIGSSYWTDFADIGLLTVSSCAAKTSMLLEFPSYWVNRDYYKVSNEKDSDMIEFEAGIVRIESADLVAEQKLGISILFNDSEVWNSTVSFTVNSTDVNAFPLANMSIADELMNEPIVSSTNIPLRLAIETNMTAILNIRLWTGTLSGIGEPAAIIRNVSLHSVDNSITCYELNTLYNNTENSSVQNFAQIHLIYVDSTTDSIGNTINFNLEVNVVPEKMNFADTYVVFFAVGNVISEYKINMKIPEILNDKQRKMSGQFHKLFDGDNNTCVNLPVKGDFPPLFWTRVHTTWFRIKASPFEITLIGKDIACQRNGYNISQVSLPMSENGFHGDIKFCNVTYDGGEHRYISKCVYNCQCKDDVECSEVILFLANHEIASDWNLCEITAVNV